MSTFANVQLGALFETTCLAHKTGLNRSLKIDNYCTEVDTTVSRDIFTKNTKSHMPKRSFIIRWGNIIFLVLMIVFALLIIANQDANPVIAFAALNAFYLVVLSAIVLSIIRIFKKYHLVRSFIWLFITPMVALLLILSFTPPPK